MYSFFNVLLIDDDHQTAAVVTQFLSKAQNFKLIKGLSLSRRPELMSTNGIDVILLELCLPESRSETTQKKMADSFPSVILSSVKDNVIAIKPVKKGRQDFPCKSKLSKGLLVRAGINSSHSLKSSLTKKFEELRETSQRKDEFLSVLSHELRTPLAAIKGYADLLDKLDPGSQEFKNAVKMIQINAEAECLLIEDVLDLSRVIVGRFKCKMDYVSIDNLIDSAIDTVALSANSKGIDVNLTKKSRARGYFVVGDEERLKQVFGSLLSNAIKFTEQSGAVEISIQRTETMISIEVTDTGCGLSSAEVAKVFDRFWQKDMSSKRKNKGLGLGLSISKKIVELHGGSISCDSQGLGCGATFEVVLPACPGTTPMERSGYPDAENSVAEPDKNLEKPLSGQMILLIEDCDALRELLGIYFTSAGASVMSFGSAAEGLAEFRRNPYQFAVVVSDIGLPDFDGYELIEKIRKLSPRGLSLPAVALTAYTSHEDEDKAKAAGFDIRIAKPVKKVELISSIVNLIRCASKHTGKLESNGYQQPLSP